MQDDRARNARWGGWRATLIVICSGTTDKSRAKNSSNSTSVDCPVPNINSMCVCVFFSLIRNTVGAVVCNLRVFREKKSLKLQLCQNLECLVFERKRAVFEQY